MWCTPIAIAASAGSISPHRDHVIDITPTISIDEGSLHWSFVRSSGPGGQNVNKVSTAVELQFDVAASGLAADTADRLRKLAGRKATAGGMILIKACQFRSQAQNREAALERLAEMIRLAAVRPKVRRATKATRSSRRKRLESKKRRSETKQLRGDLRSEVP